VPFALKLSGGFWPSAEFGAGPALAPDQKSSWNGCQQAKVSMSLKTKITYSFVLDFFPY
jgi:hypothetical protein